MIDTKVKAYKLRQLLLLCPATKLFVLHLVAHRCKSETLANLQQIGPSVSRLPSQ